MPTLSQIVETCKVWASERAQPCQLWATDTLLPYLSVSSLAFYDVARWCWNFLYNAACITLGLLLFFCYGFAMLCVSLAFCAVIVGFGVPGYAAYIYLIKYLHPLKGGDIDHLLPSANSSIDSSHILGQIVVLQSTLLLFCGMQILFTRFRTDTGGCCRYHWEGCDSCRVPWLSTLFPYFQVLYFYVRGRWIVLKVAVCVALMLSYSAVAGVLVFELVTTSIYAVFAVTKLVPHVEWFWATVFSFIPWYVLLGITSLLITFVFALRQRMKSRSDLPTGYEALA